MSVLFLGGRLDCIVMAAAETGVVADEGVNDGPGDGLADGWPALRSGVDIVEMDGSDCC